MHKIRYLLILTAFACLVSCSPKQDTGGTKIINIIEAHFVNIPMGQVLSGSEYVPLEFNPESALPLSAMFLNSTSGFYLMDLYQKKTVFQFDKKGRFVRTIGKTGQGPGEFSQLSEAQITKSGLEILSGAPNSEVCKYDLDGKFVRTDRILDRISNSFAINPKSGDYYFYGTGYEYLIQQVEGKSLQPVDSFIIRNKNLIASGVQTFSTTALGTVLFYQPFDDRIYELDGKTINLKYRFDVGASTPKYNDLDAESQRKMVSERELWFIYKALENSGWLYLMIAQQIAGDDTQSQYYSLLYEKKTGKIFCLPDTPDPGPLFRPAFALGEDNILYTAVQPAIINQSDEWKSEFKRRGIPLTPDGNFIVVKIPLGKIVK